MDHVAVTQILKAKTEPASNRIMRLLDRLSASSFNPYYLKGKDMILADCLSRHRNEDEDPSDLIPVSFCKLRDIEDFCVGTRASVKASGEMVPEVHGVDKELGPHITPEQQYVSKVATTKGAKPKSTMKTPVQDSPHKTELETTIDPVKVTQLKDKAEIPTKSPKLHQRMPYSSPRVSLIQPKSYSIGTRQKGDSNGESIEKDESDVDLKFTRRKYNLGIDMGEGEEILDPEIKIPEESDFYEPEPLKQVVDVKKQWYKFLPKQGNVDKILTQINHKILRDAKLPLMLKDLKAAYLTSPHFKDVYLHLLQNRALINKFAAHRLEVSACNYMILDALLFRITNPQSSTTVWPGMTRPTR